MTSWWQFGQHWRTTKTPVAEVVTPPSAPEPVAAPVPEWSPDYGCSKHPKERKNHQPMIHADLGDEAKKVWCDCCGGIPVAIFPQFNRLLHTARLCEDCLSLGIGAIDNAEAKARAAVVTPTPTRVRHYRRE